MVGAHSIRRAGFLGDGFFTTWAVAVVGQAAFVGWKRRGGTPAANRLAKEQPAEGE